MARTGKIQVASTILEADVYKVLRRCVEEGVGYGLHRAYKHEVKPLSDDDRARLADHIEIEVMNSIADMFNFE